MSLSLFPVRIEIGQFTDANGRAVKVYQSPEFSRALTDLFARVGGAQGTDAASLELLAGFTPGEVPDASALSDSFELAALRGELAGALGQLGEALALVSGMAQRIEALEVQQPGVPTLSGMDWGRPGYIGALTPNQATFTILGVTSTTTLSPANANVTISPTGTGTVTINPATAGTMNNVAIGGTTKAAGGFTTIATTDNISITRAAGVPKISVTATTGTNETYLQFINTGGGYYFGVENSASGWFGATAYAGVVSVPAGKVFQQLVGGTVRTATSGTGFDVTGATAISGAFGCNGKAAQTAAASGGTLAGVITALVAMGILSS